MMRFCFTEDCKYGFDFRTELEATVKIIRMKISNILNSYSSYFSFAQSMQIESDNISKLSYTSDIIYVHI